MSVDYAKLRAALVGITAPRAVVEQFYNGVIAELQRAGMAAPSSFLAARVQGRRFSANVQPAPNPADTADALALALLAIDQPDAIFDAATAAIVNGLFDPPGSDAAAQEGVRTATTKRLLDAFANVPAPPPTPGAQQQMATNRGEIFEAPELMIPALMIANKRLCRVETFDADGSSVTGTGFLVGPSAVLTNQHVVRSKLADATIPLTVTFDFSQLTSVPTGSRSVFQVGKEGGKREWCLHHSTAGTGTADIRAPGWWMDDDARAAWVAEHAATLDYAVVILAGAPGLQRGWYDLAGVAQPQKDIGCQVLQHPEGRGRARTSGKLAFETRQPRMFHTASTRKGSSGGLIIDDAGRPVGLHYLGLGREAAAGQPPPLVPQEVVNVGIPLETIARDLGAARLSALGLHPSLVPARGCLAGGQPLFGRQELLTALPLLASGERRILWVKPPATQRFEKPGKSFTVTVLETLFPPPDNHFIRLSADKVPVDDRTLAALLVDALGGASTPALPEPATSDAAYDAVLASAVVAADRAGDARRRVWLVIDELDRIDIPDSGGARFLDRLYSRIADINRLRIVLIGMKNARTQIPELLLAKNEILDTDVSAIKAMFADWLDTRTAGGRPIDRGVTEMLGELAESFAGSTAPLATISAFVVSHLNPPLARYVDR